MARLMFSRRELRLVCEADSVVTRPLFPLRLEIDVVTAMGETVFILPNFLLLDHLVAGIGNKPEVCHQEEDGGGREYGHGGLVVREADHEGEDEGQMVEEAEKGEHKPGQHHHVTRGGHPDQEQDAGQDVDHVKRQQDGEEHPAEEGHPRYLVIVHALPNLALALDVLGDVVGVVVEEL